MNGNPIEFGLCASVLALGCAIFAVFFAFSSLKLNRPALMVSARQAMYMMPLLITFSCFTIIWSFVNLDFSVAYVVQNSNSKLPMIYRLSALWGAHEGSLMLWLWFLVIYSALATYIHRFSHPQSMPYIIITLALLQIGFLVFILFLSSPFTELVPPPLEGRELNPLLQDPGLIFHPPLLYLGYVGFSVPYAFAIAALIRGQADGEWAKATRKWTLFAWIALTSGILLGGYWAYYELGWGGYWAWDAVENASLMPWFTGTAFLHSILVLERRGLFATWNIFLVLVTFCLSLLGTFLVRSGVLTSVHAFATDPSRGVYILGFLSLVMIVSFGLLVFRSNRLYTPPQQQSFLSRESILLLNNIFLLCAAGTVFLGTLYPLIAEVITGAKVTVAAPYFNSVVLPFMIIVIFLMGIGPVIPWYNARRQASAYLLRKQFLYPVLCSLLFIAVGIGFGIRDMIGLFALSAVGFSLCSTLLDIFKDIKNRAQIEQTGKTVPRSYLKSFWHLLTWNRRRYGAMIVHIGVLIAALGMIASGTLNQVNTVTMAPGDRFQSGAYVLTFKGIEGVKGPNYSARRASFLISQQGHPLDIITAERRSYPRGNMVTTEAGIRSGFFEDLYIVLGQETKNDKAIIRFYYNPLINWIWFGWMILVAGSLLAFSQGRSQKVVFTNDGRVNEGALSP